MTNLRGAFARRRTDNSHPIQNTIPTLCHALRENGYKHCQIQMDVPSGDPALLFTKLLMCGREYPHGNTGISWIME